MENKINERLSKLGEVYTRYQTLSEQLKNSNLSKSETQSLRLNLNNTKNKLEGIKKDINQLINSPIVVVRYSLNNTPYIARLAMSKDEAITTLNFFAKVCGLDLKIHLIKPISTFLCKKDDFNPRK